MEPTIEQVANEIRAHLQDTERDVRHMRSHSFFDNEQRTRGQHQEVHEHINLAIRHIEDARMRLGKVCQYAGDGVSCFDK